MLIFSCSKNKDQCHGNCVDVEISGQVFDSSNRTGLSNMPVKIIWADSGSSIEDIGNGTTDNAGNFKIKATIDTSKFAPSTRIVVLVKIPAGYITAGNVRPNPNDEAEKYIYQYTGNIAGLQFVFYQQAILTVNFQRTQSDVFSYFESRYQFEEPQLKFVSANSPLTTNVYTLYTAANIYTKVSWLKAYASGQIAGYSDSVKCLANSVNSITVNY
jgi:hypothetical protein